MQPIALVEQEAVTANEPAEADTAADTAAGAAGRQRVWGAGRAAGVLLVLSFFVNSVGILMFVMRDGASGRALTLTLAYYAWERSLIMAAALLSVVGFALLEEYLHHSAGSVAGRIGATIYLCAGILLIAAEALGLRMGDNALYSLMACAVVLTYLGQAALGAALVQAKLTATWIGWTAVVWNLGWLAVLVAITPRDIYFPALHYFIPLLIGIALLWKAPARRVP